ncbi:MAG: hypothetical protein CVU39_00015 [Chloroflexi bacterium HGW-Chloroflexi-10]|nr:MAG: hypothetical protein CVU39_00015 [Chloroflexi bacterium HGW-Chloroflexi-10]
MTLLLIEKGYQLHFSDLDHSQMDIKPDVHTVRVLYRLGISAATTENEAIQAAKRFNPQFPGGVDGALWKIGRQWCNSSRPLCSQCPMRVDCAKIGV